MVSISLCMIVKNEETTLPQCLNSIKDIVDEIIIVDTGSEDKTKDIAYRYTNKVYDFEWIDDFSAARNFSFSKATKDFILWLDADDIIFEKDREAFKRLKDFLTLQYDTVVMKYVLKRDAKGNETYVSYRERLVKRASNFKWHDPIHEYLDFSGKIVHSEIAVTHTKTCYNANRNLKILKKIISNSKDVNPRHIFYYARESQDIGNTEEAILYYLKLLSMDNIMHNHELSSSIQLSPFIEGSIQLANIYFDRNEKEKALRVLIRSLKYGLIRAEISCLIGKYYLDNKEYSTAISWYELALSLKKPKLTWQFFMHEYWDFIPYIELCHCYYHLGNITKALEYHKQAQQLKPYHPAIIQNQKFFDKVLRQINIHEESQ